MANSRRLGSEASEVRTLFIDAAEAILSEGGGRTISSRLVAERAGLKMQLLYYYFRTMDDLLLQVVQRVDQRRLERFQEALASSDPLRTMWQQLCDPASATLAAEMLAIAQHREAIRTEIVAAGERFRDLQTAAVQELLRLPVSDGVQYSADGIVMIAVAVARMMVNETALGFTKGHADALAIIEQLLSRLSSGDRPAGSPADKGG
jgi:TetR/AcrR family transcriptional regulator